MLAGGAVNTPAFHLAFPVTDLDEAKNFFVGMLGCAVGRETSQWVDFEFYGHQLSAHLRPGECGSAESNGVDGDRVPVRHFGVILEWDHWERLRDQLTGSGAEFIIKPRVRFQGQVGEQGTMFVRGPSNNALEFKTFRDMDKVFES
jgi:extradiol dioxygenase family protein